MIRAPISSLLVIAVLLQAAAFVSAEVRFEACTYSDDQCSEDEECETETSGDCADTDVDGAIGDVGIRVKCDSNLNGMHSVEYSSDDDCPSADATGTLGNLDCVLADAGFFTDTYITVRCFDSVVCFSRDATVLLETGQRTPLSQVVVGDHVRSVDDNGNSVFSEVFLTQHDSTAVDTPMLKINLVNNSRALTVTHDHYLRIPAETEAYVKASKVSAGDSLYVVGAASMHVGTVASVQRTSGIPRNVHTMNDRIVVDGVVASCVSSNQVFGLDTMQIRKLLAPLKLLHSLGLRNAVAAIDRTIHLVYTTVGKL